MSSMTQVPSSIRQWLDAQGAADPVTALADALDGNVVFTFAGRKVTGSAAVLERIASMPTSALGEVAWAVLPIRDNGCVTVRGTGPGGTPLASPGGPMSAIDFEFTLGHDGLITSISPRPHHTEPSDLLPPLTIGAKAPSFDLPDTSGAVVSSTDDAAAATIVVFTCNPCPWALGWHDRIQAVGREYAARNVRLLQIDSNDPGASPRDDVTASHARVEAGQFFGPYLVDEGQRVARRWGARHTPDVFVLDADGTVVYHGAPDADVDDESRNASWLRDALDDLLAGRAVRLAHTEPTGCTIKWTL